MKKLFVTGLAVFQLVFVSAQTTGTLSVSVATSSAGGNYAPRNVFVIWIENASGNFVKTLTANAEKRIQYLYKWSASTSAKSTQYNRVDAVTGATLSSHGTRTGIWNGTNYNKSLVPDGTYYVCFELTDKHAQGNYSRFAFTKGADNKVTPANVTGFSKISIQWTASGTTDVETVDFSNDIQIFPNPSGKLFRLRGSNITKVEVLTLVGTLLFTNRNTKEIDLGNYVDGIYLARITTGDKTVIKKLIKE
ncbi:MAG: DUF2271 domain-containing protein [Draconibacterium sp.]